MIYFKSNLPFVKVVTLKPVRGLRKVNRPVLVLANARVSLEKNETSHETFHLFGGLLLGLRLYDIISFG